MSDSNRKPPGLSMRAERTLRRTAVAVVFVIAAAAAVLSFNGLRNLALAADIPTSLAWIFPIVVDGLTLVGSLGVVHAVLTGLRSWYPWMLTLLGVGMSVWGNVASSPPVLTAQIVHAIPPIVLALSLEALLKVYRYRAVAGYMEEHASTPAEAEAAREAATHLPLPGEAPAWSEPAREVEAVASTSTPAVQKTPDPAPQVTVEARELVPERQVPGGTMREQLKYLRASDPDISAAEAARILGKDRSNVAKVLKELKAADSTDTDTPSMETVSLS